MKHENMNTVSKRTALSAALCLALGAGAAQAAPWSGNFTMYSPGGFKFAPDTTVTGTEKSTLESTTPFFGFNWVAKSITTYPASSTIPDIDTGNGSYTGVTVGANQLGGSMLFDWGAADATTTCGKANCNIDVIQVWDVSYDEKGLVTYTSTDISSGNVSSTVWAGAKMIDGPFQGYSANFNMTATPTFPITLTKNSVIFNTGSTTVSSDLSAADYTFTWTVNSDAAITGAMTSANDSPTITFTTGGLTVGQSYKVSVNATRDSDSEVVRADITVTPISLTLNDANDSDGDGIGDNTEGSSDANGNGIPDFLDNANLTTKQLAVDTSDGSTGRVLTTDTGVLSLGNTALSVGTANLQAGTLKWAAEVAASDFTSTNDDVMESSCVGGCFDFKVTGLSNGGVAKIVIPLGTALPAYPIYRKYNNSQWNGFAITDDDSISSAAATSTDPVTCPAPGDSAYSKVGLTPGDYCIQLTIKDGGGNDADGSANGTIVDPGGVANGKQSRLEANVPSGCSMSTTPVKPTERADWWLVAGFLGALAWLRGMRRKAHSA